MIEIYYKLVGFKSRESTYENILYAYNFKKEKSEHDLPKLRISRHSKIGEIKLIPASDKAIHALKE